MKEKKKNTFSVVPRLPFCQRARERDWAGEWKAGSSSTRHVFLEPSAPSQQWDARHEELEGEFCSWPPPSHQPHTTTKPSNQDVTCRSSQSEASGLSTSPSLPPFFSQSPPSSPSRPPSSPSPPQCTTTSCQSASSPPSPTSSPTSTSSCPCSQFHTLRNPSVFTSALANFPPTVRLRPQQCVMIVLVWFFIHDSCTHSDCPQPPNPLLTSGRWRKSRWSRSRKKPYTPTLPLINFCLISLLFLKDRLYFLMEKTRGKAKT